MNRGGGGGFRGPPGGAFPAAAVRAAGPDRFYFRATWDTRSGCNVPALACQSRHGANVRPDGCGVTLLGLQCLPGKSPAICGPKTVLSQADRV